MLALARPLSFRLATCGKKSLKHTTIRIPAMSFCKHCTEGVRHDGDAKGQVVDVEGHRLYLAEPKKDSPSDKGLLLLTDVFGLELNNNKLIADAYADNGIKTYMPDLFNNDAVPEDAFSTGFNLQSWFPNHGADKTRPSIDATLAKMKADGVKKIAAVGYCFGARYVFDLAFEKKIDVAAVCHPSLLKCPEDLEKMKATGIPIFFGTCETDPQFPVDSQKKADEIFGDAKTYKRAYYAGNTHGFAVRGDMSNPKVKEAKEDVFKQCYEWFTAHL